MLKSIYLQKEVDLGLQALSKILNKYLINDSSLSQKSNYPCIKNSSAIDSYLFGYYNIGNELKLEQILLRYNKQENVFIKVKSGNTGIIYIPHIGYFKTKQLNKELLIQLNKKSPTKSILKHTENNDLIKFDYIPVTKINNTNIEVSQYSDHYITSQLYEATKNSQRDIGNPDFEKNISKYMNYINKALPIIKQVDKEQYEEISKTCQKLVLFKAKEIIAFTSIDLHGVIFIRPRSTDNEVYFIDHFIHECSHIALNCALLNLEDYFAIDPFKTQFKSPFRVGEKRGVYHTFHACYVLSKLINFYDKWMAKKVEQKFYFDVLGRLLLAVYRLEEGLSFISSASSYTEKGLKVYKQLEQILHKAKKNHKQLIQKYVVKNQPIEFNLKMFLKTNKKIIQKGTS